MYPGKRGIRGNCVKGFWITKILYYKLVIKWYLLDNNLALKDKLRRKFDLEIIESYVNFKFYIFIVIQSTLYEVSFLF